jgi:hypothetical protein
MSDRSANSEPGATGPSERSPDGPDGLDGPDGPDGTGSGRDETRPDQPRDARLLFLGHAIREALRAYAAVPRPADCDSWA